MTPETISNELYARISSAREVPLDEVKKIVPKSAAPGGLGSYRWFLIGNIPTDIFEFTLSDMLNSDPDEANRNKRRHDKIVKILEAGEPEWPIVVSADGIVFDGYHRIVAHDTMGHETVSVLVAVKKRPTGDEENVLDAERHQEWIEEFHR